MTPVRSLGRPRWLDISVALASLSACTGAPAPSPSGPAPGAAPSSPAPDPRTGLAPGLFDAGEAIWNMRRVSSTRPPQEFVGSTNSDLAFTGDYVIQGNYNGIQIWDVVDPARPSLAAQYVCPASQSDVSVHGRLLFVSGEGLEGRLDCGREPPRPAASPERLRGIRIFDISDIRSPRYIANVQTCRGSHTHTLLQDPDDDENIYLYVSGSAPVRPAAELAGCSGAPPERDPTSALFRIEVIRVPLANPERAEIVSSPRIFADLAAPPTHGLAPAELAEVEAARARGAFVLEMAGQVQVMPDAVATMMLDTMVARRGGAGPPTAQDSASLRETLAQMTRMTASLPAGARPGPTQCHDITVYPAIGLAAGACEGYGFLLDITDPVNPRRIDAVSDSSFAYWHSATIDNEGTQVLFTDEWGGGAQPKCRASDPREWGADAIFSLEERRMRFRGYYKLPAAQPETENCVAHNGSLIPIPGRDVMVQAWYQGGISVFDWTDPERPVEIAYFDRGAANPAGRGMAGTWSAYWYNGHVVSSEISRGLDILSLPRARCSPRTRSTPRPRCSSTS
jgi:hypothetical protein